MKTISGIGNTAVGRSRHYSLVREITIPASVMRHCLIIYRSFNTAMGSDALNLIINSSHNVAIGVNALYKHKIGDYNVVIGKEACI